jgi:hypothetical protein
MRKKRPPIIQGFGIIFKGTSKNLGFLTFHGIQKKIVTIQPGFHSSNE